MILGSPAPLFGSALVGKDGKAVASFQQWLLAVYGKNNWHQASAPTAAVTLTTAFGTPGTALSDVGTSFNQATLNNNFASVVAKTTNLETRISQLYAVLKAAGYMA